MRLFDNKIRLDFKNGFIEWDPYGPKYKTTNDPKDIYDYAHHIAFYPNWLSKQYRHWGLKSIQFDGETFTAFGFWYFNFSWCI